MVFFDYCEHKGLKLYTFLMNLVISVGLEEFPFTREGRIVVYLLFSKTSCYLQVIGTANILEIY